MFHSGKHIGKLDKRKSLDIRVYFTFHPLALFWRFWLVVAGLVGCRRLTVIYNLVKFLQELLILHASLELNQFWKLVLILFAHPQKLLLGQVSIAVSVNEHEELLSVFGSLLLCSSSHSARHISIHHRINCPHHSDHLLLVNCTAVVYIVPESNIFNKYALEDKRIKS